MVVWRVVEKESCRRRRIASLRPRASAARSEKCVVIDLIFQMSMAVGYLHTTPTPTVRRASPRSRTLRLPHRSAHTHAVTPRQFANRSTLRFSALAYTLTLTPSLARSAPLTPITPFFFSFPHSIIKGCPPPSRRRQGRASATRPDAAGPASASCCSRRKSSSAMRAVFSA